MTRRTLIGVDVGTSVAKAAAFDEHGRLLAEASRTVALDRPAHDRVEQDARDVLAQVDAVVGEVLAATGDGPDLVAVTAQGDGCWLVDAAGAPVRPAISWLDGRAADLVRQWRAEGLTDRLFGVTGTAVFSGLQSALLAWLDREEPATLDRAATAAYCKDVVFQALTGERCTDVSDASAPFGVPAPAAGADRTGYDRATLAAYGLEHRAGLLAPVAPGLPAAPARTGTDGPVPAGTLVTGGPYDLAACATGAGVECPGAGLLILGTTLACLVPTTADAVTAGAAGAGPPDDPAGLLLRLPEAGRFLRAMPAMVGTTGLDWALALTGREHGELGDLLAGSPPGARGVRALPYFASSGERAPFVDPAARAQLTGLSVATTAADVVRAVCESLAFAARQCFDVVGLTGPVTVSGGGTRSTAWLEVIASALGRPLQVASVAQVGARGAVLAGLRHGGADALGVDPDAWELVDRVVDPRPDLLDRYEAGYARYLDDQQEARRRWHRAPAPVG